MGEIRNTFRTLGIGLVGTVLFGIVLLSLVIALSKPLIVPPGAKGSLGLLLDDPAVFDQLHDLGDNALIDSPSADLGDDPRTKRDYLRRFEQLQLHFRRCDGDHVLGPAKEIEDDRDGEGEPLDGC